MLADRVIVMFAGAGARAGGHRRSRPAARHREFRTDPLFWRCRPAFGICC